MPCYNMEMDLLFFFRPISFNLIPSCECVIEVTFIFIDLLPIYTCDINRLLLSGSRFPF